MNSLRKGFIMLTVSGLLLGGAGFALAQPESVPPQASDPLAQGQRAQRGAEGHRGHGSQRRGALGLPLGRFSLGTTVEVSFYNGDPENGGTAQTSLTHVVGEDSEVAFAEAFQAARENATHMTVSVSEQTRTLDLNAVRERSEARGGNNRRGGAGGLGRMGAGLNRLNEGSTVNATFYDADPEAGGNVLQTLSFAYGVDSARGFMAEAAELAQDAAFVTVTTSPQERTLETSEMAARGNQGRRGFGPGRSR